MTEPIQKTNQIYITFFTAFFQVLFVVMNTYFISIKSLPLVAICSLMIAILWVINVGSVAKNSLKLKLAYIIGSTLGSITGFIIASNLIK